MHVVYFSYPFPQGADPLEDYMLKNGKLKYIICFGETDYMDQVGSRRLEKHDPDRFKVLIVSKKGHRFPIENAKEVANRIISNLYEDKISGQISQDTFSMLIQKYEKQKIRNKKKLY